MLFFHIFYGEYFYVISYVRNTCCSLVLTVLERADEIYHAKDVITVHTRDELQQEDAHRQRQPSWFVPGSTQLFLLGFLSTPLTNSSCQLEYQTPARPRSG